MPETPRKCDHPGCNCNAREGSSYCGAYCESNEEPEILCECGHSDCQPKV
jgi:hypothetical protein